MWYKYVDEDEFADDENEKEKDDTSSTLKDKADYDNVAYKRDFDTESKF